MDKIIGKYNRELTKKIIEEALKEQPDLWYSFGVLENRKKLAEWAFEKEYR